MTDRTKIITVFAVYAVLLLLCLSGVLLTNFSRGSLTALAISSFGAVISAALLISWGAECYQFVVSQGFAVAVIALLQVIPEFFVEGTIAWQKDVPLMLANFTGSNRLLMGLGWSGVFFIASFMNFLKTGKWLREIKIREEHSIEVFALLVSSAYFFIVLLKGSISLIDSAVLLFLFVLYMWALFKLEPEEKEKQEDLLDICKVIVKIRAPLIRRSVIYFLFAAGGLTFVFVAAPFIQSLRELSSVLGVSTFVFVQWVAPFLSEFPEKVTAFYWASRTKLAPMGLVNFISSKINQWTLLIAMVPAVYSVSMGRFSVVHLDSYHKWQIFLSIAMTLYGCAVLAKFSFAAVDAFFMFVLWFVQFVFPDTLIITTWIFLGLTLITLVLQRKKMRLFPCFLSTCRRSFSKAG